MNPMRFSVFALTMLLPSVASAQAPSAPPTVTVPTVTVTAQKEPADPQKLPVSLSTVQLDPLWNGGMTTLGEASIYAPNTFFSDFTARKLSNPRFRGIGSSPANPAITTYIDGVPQLNTNSSSIEFLDISQIEFVRGPQSSLFGRNTLGGLVNVTSARPSLSKWSGSAVVPFGNYDAIDIRANASGPIGSKAALGFSIGHQQRDGFTTNAITGNDLDYRDALFGKAQLLLTPTAQWEARLIYTGERARDGDYALMDLGAARQSPFNTQRDFEGHTDRDIHAVTFLARHEGKRFTFASTTGYVNWKTLDETDLDYTPFPIVTRKNDEQDGQFTQEFRFASSASAPAKLSDSVSFKWQTGVFLFTQNYEVTSINTYAPFVLSPFINTPVDEYNPVGTLDDAGVGVYGSGTFQFGKVDVTVGARGDYENRKADLSSFLSGPLIQSIPRIVDTEETFSNVSPQFSVAFRPMDDAMIYGSVTGGYKAGGFNTAAPGGNDVYGEEKSLNIEGGLKTAWLGRRLTANVAVFTIDWDDLQLNVPNTQVPGQFYISNVGGARSSGIEFELNGRANENMDVFATFGYTHARFGSGTFSGGLDVSDNDIPNTPEFTSSFGAQVSHPISNAIRLYGRGEAVFYGSFKYDDLNLAQQDAYSLANFRGGAKARNFFVEAWVRNAFDTKYVPVAFAYGQLAPSGFVGEPGRPRTFGLTAGVGF